MSDVLPPPPAPPGTSAEAEVVLKLQKRLARASSPPELRRSHQPPEFGFAPTALSPIDRNFGAWDEGAGALPGTRGSDGEPGDAHQRRKRRQRRSGDEDGGSFFAGRSEGLAEEMVPFRAQVVATPAGPRVIYDPVPLSSLNSVGDRPTLPSQEVENVFRSSLSRMVLIPSLSDVARHALNEHAARRLRISRMARSAPHTPLPDVAPYLRVASGSSGAVSSSGASTNDNLLIPATTPIKANSPAAKRATRRRRSRRLPASAHQPSDVNRAASPPYGTTTTMHNFAETAISQQSSSTKDRDGDTSLENSDEAEATSGGLRLTFSDKAALQGMRRSWLHSRSERHRSGLSEGGAETLSRRPSRVRPRQRSFGNGIKSNVEKHNILVEPRNCNSGAQTVNGSKRRGSWFGLYPLSGQQEALPWRLYGQTLVWLERPSRRDGDDASVRLDSVTAGTTDGDDTSFAQKYNSKVPYDQWRKYRRARLLSAETFGHRDGGKQDDSATTKVKWNMKSSFVSNALVSSLSGPWQANGDLETQNDELCVDTADDDRMFATSAISPAVKRDERPPWCVRDHGSARSDWLNYDNAFAAADPNERDSAISKDKVALCMLLRIAGIGGGEVTAREEAPCTAREKGDNQNGDAIEELREQERNAVAAKVRSDCKTVKEAIVACLRWIKYHIVINHNGVEFRTTRRIDVDDVNVYLWQPRPTNTGESRVKLGVEVVIEAEDGPRAVRCMRAAARTPANGTITSSDGTMAQCKLARELHDRSPFVVWSTAQQRQRERRKTRRLSRRLSRIEIRRSSKVLSSYRDLRPSTADLLKDLSSSDESDDSVVDEQAVACHIRHKRECASFARGFVNDVIVQGTMRAAVMGLPTGEPLTPLTPHPSEFARNFGATARPHGRSDDNDGATTSASILASQGAKVVLGARPARDTDPASAVLSAAGSTALWDLAVRIEAGLSITPKHLQRARRDLRRRDRELEAAKDDFEEAIRSVQRNVRSMKATVVTCKGTMLNALLKTEFGEAKQSSTTQVVPTREGVVPVTRKRRPAILSTVN